MTPEAGQRFGPYEILGRVGGGGMGHVFRAWDARLHREVAIKLLHNEYAMPGMRERFLREARAASSLNHPNICTVFDIGEQGGDPYLVMELLEGETLRDRIQRSTIQPDELIAIASEVAEALGAAHNKGVVHRDIKPANIFLARMPNSRTQSKVLDFGLAKLQRESVGLRGRGSDLTSAGATVGTLAYMSPEQARGEVLDLRSDLFSLGVVMYEMATRQVPFPGATSALVFVKLLNQPPEPVRDWNESIPRDLERIILKLMSKERTARFQTAGELEGALAKLADKSSGGWLRKAVATVPLVRAVDPVARERRLPRRRSSDWKVESDPDLNPPEPTHAARPTGQFLRPVNRLPDPGGDPNLSSGELGVSRRPAEQPPVSRAEQARTDADPTGMAALTGSATELPVESGQRKEPAAHNGSRRLWRRPLLWVLVGAVGVSALLYLALRSRTAGALVSSSDLLAVGGIENRTGNPVLDGTVSTAFAIDLDQSPYLRVASPEDYLASLRLAGGGDLGTETDRRRMLAAATRLGADALLLGTVEGHAPPFTLHLELLGTADDTLLAEFDTQAGSLQEIPAAVDRLSVALRARAGESRSSIAEFQVPLQAEATANLSALHSYALAEAERSAGQPSLFLAALRDAVRADGHFPQAQMALVDVYHALHAELSAAEAARLAVAASAGASPRLKLLAQLSYELNSTGDDAAALANAHTLLQDNPQDVLALIGSSRVLLRQGRLAEALQAAQQAYTEDPFSPEAYGLAQAALIGLDRDEAAAKLSEQVRSLGLSGWGTYLVSAYLQQRGAAPALPYSGTLLESWGEGLALDNQGRLADGAVLWQTSAGDVRDREHLPSAAAYLLAQGALDRGLLGDCPAATPMLEEAAAAPHGPEALFRYGMAAALCDRAAVAQQALQELATRFPKNSAARDYMQADLRAALALRNNDPAEALAELQNTRQSDLISLSPLLRGRAHVAQHQMQIGIVDFQTVLSHPGISFVAGSTSYPAAQIGVARAFEEMGDLDNSAEAYRRFLLLWKSADASQSLYSEARAHATVPRPLPN